MRSFETTQTFKFEHTQMFNLLVEKPRPHFTHPHAHFVNAYFVNAFDTFVLLWISLMTSKLWLMVIKYGVHFVCCI